jgi:hypothetical protein
VTPLGSPYTAMKRQFCRWRGVDVLQGKRSAAPCVRDLSDDDRRRGNADGGGYIAGKTIQDLPDVAGLLDQAINLRNEAASEVALDLRPYLFPAKFHWLKSRFSDIRHKARRHLGESQLEATHDPLYTG